MNAFRILSTLTTLVVCCSSSPSPIFAPHVALPHNLPHASSVTFKHHGTPAAVAHHAVAPVAVAHHAPSNVALSHSLPVGVNHGYLPTAPVSYGAPASYGAPVSYGAPASYGSPLSYGTPLSYGAPVSYGTPAVAVAHASPLAHVNTYSHTAPVTHVNSYSHAAPVTHVNSYSHAAPVTSVNSQYHSQDELGQYAFGYNSDTSSRDETRDAYGNVRGSFSYVDPYGNVQSQNYVADDYGFRVTGTNLPVHVTNAHDHRYKRSYATFPASTGPLTTVSHVAHVAPVVHHVAPVVHKVAPVVHHVGPVVHKVAPVVHNVGPLVHNVAPAVHAAPIGLEYGSIPRYGNSYYPGPSVTTYRNYNYPVFTHKRFH